MEGRQVNDYEEAAKGRMEGSTEWHHGRPVSQDWTLSRNNWKERGNAQEKNFINPTVRKFDSVQAILNRFWN